MQMADRRRAASEWGIDPADPRSDFTPHDVSWGRPCIRGNEKAIRSLRGPQWQEFANRRAMRNAQNNKHRMRGRNRGGKSHNPLTRVYESNGPDVKIRGTANHVAEKYIQLARDATASGDPVAAENYYQHAEHYFRLIAAAQEQFRQSSAFPQRSDGSESRGDEGYDDGDDSQPAYGSNEPHTPREQQQNYNQREQQPYQQRDNQQPRSEFREQRESRPQEDRQDSRQDGRPEGRPDNRRFDNRQPHPGNGAPAENVERLPSFITGGPAAVVPTNGHEGQGDRFPLNRRRRRPRTPRPEGEAGDDSAAIPPVAE
jgi:hypothetical protein